MPAVPDSIHRMSANAPVLIVGIGEVGRYMLEFLLRDSEGIEVVAADVDESSVRSKLDNALFGAALHGHHPEARALEIDLFDVDRTAALLATMRPRVVVNCAVLQTWHVIRRLPDDVYERLSSAGLGAWLPVQLALPMKLGQAIAASGISTHYVNTSLSDLTNPVLRAMGIAPTVGIGNVVLIQTAVRALVARRFEVPQTAVEVTMVAHHIHWVLWREKGYREGAPFYMKIVVEGEDVTSRFDTTALMKEAILLYPRGTSFSAVSASSAIHNVKALLSETPVRTHSPGPNGLPGGYPVTISREGVSVDLPPDLSLEEAVAMNEEAQTYDGIERIDEEARVHFMPYAIETMREVLGFDCPSFTPEECVDRAREQMRRFQALESRYGT